MGYTLVKGGDEAILEAERLFERLRVCGGRHAISVSQIEGRMKLAVGQVMGEGGLYSPEIAALAVKQAEGDLMEAAFLVRAYRTTLPRLGYSVSNDTDCMVIMRRISSAFKDVPGGQILGATRDYTPHLLDFSLIDEENQPGFPDDVEEINVEVEPASQVRVLDLLRAEGLVNRTRGSGGQEPFDITRKVMNFPAPRSARLQALSRGESGAMLCLAYSSLRGFGSWHPTISELRVGFVSVTIIHPYTGAAVSIGNIEVTECESLASQRESGQSPKDGKGSLSVGYGLVFGHNERKAIAMSILDGTTSTATGEGRAMPAANQEFVFYHIDAIDAMGFVEHLKLPHYVDFQSSLQQHRQTQPARAGTTGRGGDSAQ